MVGVASSSSARRRRASRSWRPCAGAAGVVRRRGGRLAPGCRSGGSRGGVLRPLRRLRPEQRFLAREPCARGRGCARLLRSFLRLHLHDLRLDRREQLPPLREHRADGRALAVELREGRAARTLRVLQTFRRSGEPVLRADGGRGDVLLGGRDVPRVLHRVDHVRELGAADEQLDQVRVLALVDRDEQPRGAPLRDQALLLGDATAGRDLPPAASRWSRAGSWRRPTRRRARRTACRARSPAPAPGQPARSSPGSPPRVGQTTPRRRERAPRGRAQRRR